MNIQKSEIRASILREYQSKTQGLGTDADDEMLKLEGGIGAFQLVSRTLEQNKGFYKKKLLDKEITQDEYKLIMETIDRDLGAVLSLTTTSQIERQRKAGKILAFKRITELLKRDVDQETAKIVNFKAAVETGEISLETDGTARPAMLNPLADLDARRAEAQVKKSQSPSEKLPEKKNSKRKEAATKAKNKATDKASDKAIMQTNIRLADSTGGGDIRPIVPEKESKLNASERADGRQKAGVGARKRVRV